MSWIRALVFGLPVLLVALLVASFATVQLVPLVRKNEAVISIGGEPKLLNPIQSTDAPAGQVQALIFDGLLRFNEDLEIEPHLATGWRLWQISTIFFHNETQAQQAVAVIEAARDRWEEWTLSAIEANDAELRLRLDTPGTRQAREIHALLAGDTVQPLSIIRVELKSSARDSVAHFREQAVHAHQIKRVWIEGSGAYEMTVSGEAGPFIEELNAYYADNADLDARVSVTETAFAVNEPEILFELRDDVRWHDGAPFTSKDVLFTYRMIMDETIASPRRPDYELIQSVETPGPHQVRVIYRKPYSPALNSWAMGILPEHILAGKPSTWWATDFNRSPIGTGPFKFALWRTNEVIRLARNPDYFRGQPHLDSVAFRIIPDPVGERLTFETKQIDFWGVAPHAVGKFREDERFDIFAGPGASYSYVGWNLRRPLFQDIRVRRALAHAVDVGAIIKYVMYGYGQQATGMWNPEMWWYDRGVAPVEYDPAKARQLLAEAGWKPGPDNILVKDGKQFSFDLVTNQGNEVRRDIATLVQADLRKIGIKVNVEIYEWAVFLKQFIQSLDFDATVLGWTFGADYDQYQIWHSTQTGPGQLNHVGYGNPQVDKLLEEIRAEFDRERIIELAAEIQKLVYADQPYLFLFIPYTTNVMWKDTLRVARPDEATGRLLDEPVRRTKAGLLHYAEWFYLPAHSPPRTTGE